MTKTVVEFFWDPASPYTYLASTQIEKLVADCGAALRWKPFLLGKVFEATGNRPPIGVPAKGRNLGEDLKRWARLYQVPFQWPKLFPLNSVAAGRAGIAADRAGKAAEFAKAAMRVYWTEGRDLSQPAEIKAVADSAGLDGDAIVAATAEASIKDELRSNTEEAVRRGAFGAPTFFVGEEMFWGNDRLELLRAFLKNELAA